MSSGAAGSCSGTAEPVGGVFAAAGCVFGILGDVGERILYAAGTF